MISAWKRRRHLGLALIVLGALVLVGVAASGATYVRVSRHRLLQLITTRATATPTATLPAIEFDTADAASAAILPPAPTARASVAGVTFRTGGYALEDWPDPIGPYGHQSVSFADPRAADGARLVKRDGVLYEQPVTQAEDGLAALAAYRASSAPSDDGMRQALLATALADGRHIVANHMLHAATPDVWWLPYLFDFAEYGQAQDTARAPWFSGMAQGQALDLFTGLYSMTGDPQWRDAADHTFAAFLAPLQQEEVPSARPWVDHVDADGWLWIEEYPSPNENDHTINGFGFALYGLIDYWHLSGDRRAATLAQGALATYLRAATLARNPGGISSYSLSHPGDRAASYHLVVTRQLTFFAAATGDVSFAALARAFTADYSG